MTVRSFHSTSLAFYTPGQTPSMDGCGDWPVSGTQQYANGLPPPRWVQPNSWCLVLHESPLPALLRRLGHLQHNGPPHHRSNGHGPGR